MKRIMVSHIEMSIIKSANIFDGFEWKLEQKGNMEWILTVYCSNQQFYNACILIGKYKQQLHQNTIL